MLREYIKARAFPLRGGVVTVRDATQLKLGEFSVMQNLRNDHPGMRKRKGSTLLHEDTIIAAKDIVNMYQYRSVRGGEQSLFVQVSDNKLYQQDTSKVKIPDNYDGGGADSGFTSVLTGSASQVPASFSNVKDHMLFSNGADQHQVYCGSDSLVDRCVVFDGSAAPPDIPEEGRDYSDQVRDANNTTAVAVFDSLNTYANNECIFIMTKVPCNSLTFDVSAANGTSSVATLYYWNGTAWAAVSGFTDGTASGGATLAIDGDMTWTASPTGEQEKYMYGSNGFWYQIRVSVQLDAEVEVNSITFDDSTPQDLRNVWDGNEEYAVEVQVQNAGDYYTYGGASVDVSSLPDADEIYIACADKIEGIYIDPGDTPNTGGADLNTTSGVSYWDGDSWANVTSFTDGSSDGTSTFAHPGWITFSRHDAQPTEFNGSKYQAYWYRLTIDNAAIDADVVLEISYMPYYDIEEFGSIGQTNCVWKDRGCYSFNIYGPYIYVSATARPMVLNGSDYGILKAGDGRYNKVVAQTKFVNELLVFQEEIGHEGGCVTLFEGYSPSNFGKLVLSSKIGAMNAKSVTVVDGVMTATKTDERLKTMCFFLSRYGVCATDGRTISIVSDDIQNYFDPQETECINIDYKDKMWLAHDPADNVIRVGLVSGSAATSCNIFPVFDLVDKTWSFDVHAQDLSCVVNVSSDSGATASEINSVQLGGGDDDGYIYVLNSGLNDANGASASAITGDLYIELAAEGEHMILDEMLVRIESGLYDPTISFFKDGVDTTLSKVLDATSTSDSSKHRFYLNQQGHHLAVRFRNNTGNSDMKIYELGFGVKIWEGL